MADKSSWMLDRQTRQLQTSVGQAGGLWKDDASKFINERYLRPHQGQAESLISQFKAIEKALDDIQDLLKQHRTAADKACEQAAHVDEEVEAAEQQISAAMDSIGRALDHTGRSVQIDAQALALALSAGSCCDGCAAENGGFEARGAPRSLAVAPKGLSPGTHSTAIASAISLSTMAIESLERWSDEDMRTFEKFFGKPSESARNELKTALMQVSRALATIRVVDAPKDTSAGTFAFVYADDKSHTVYVTPVFKRSELKGTDSQPGTLIHETSHFADVYGTRDYIYGFENCILLAQSNPGKAVYNADSLQYYCESMQS
jgi:hypothetical protein